MTINENLLVTAMEECAEIQKDISKALRFAVDNHNPNMPNFTNGENIICEFYQLCAVIELLQTNGVLPEFSGPEILGVKMDKLKNIYKYQEVSREYGCLED